MVDSSFAVFVGYVFVQSHRLSVFDNMPRPSFTLVNCSALLTPSRPSQV